LVLGKAAEKGSNKARFSQISKPFPTTNKLGTCPHLKNNQDFKLTQGKFF
jgi:hypothetical protein